MRVQVACHQLAITLGIAAAGGIGAALSEVKCNACISFKRLCLLYLEKLSFADLLVAVID
jgi:hypothetical protein